MALTEADVREILRLIDESELDELRIETDDFKLHVVRGEAAAEVAPEASPAATAARPSGGPSSTIDAPMPGTFYRVGGTRAGSRSWTSAPAWSRTPWSASSRS